MTRIAFGILGAILASAAPAVATAQGGATRAVSYAGLDLSSETGREILDRRIDSTVRRVCGHAWPIDLGAVERVRRCRSETFAAVAAERRVGEVYVAQVALR